MRYDQSVRAMKILLNSGWLGDIVLATIDMRAIPHWMPWSQKLPSLSTFVMSIHHLDTFRYWFGTPDRVLASTRPDPRTKFPHSRWHQPLHPRIRYRHSCHELGRRLGRPGPRRGGVRHRHPLARRGDRTAWPAARSAGRAIRRARRARSTTRTSATQTWHQPRWNEVWFPDAFVGTMAQLLVALEDGTEPEISGRDNLETIALCEAVFAAAQEHRVTTVSEFLR